MPADNTNLLQFINKITAGMSTRPAYNHIIENLSGSVIKVAAGQLSFTCGTHFQFPDVGAAIGIAEASGAVVTDFSGNRDKLFTGEELFCSNVKIHQGLLKTAT